MVQNFKYRFGYFLLILIITAIVILIFIAKNSFLFFDIGCDGGGIANGYKKTYYENGNIKRITQVENCLINGFEINYDENKNIREFNQGKNGKIFGIVTQFDTLGNLIGFKKFIENKYFSISVICNNEIVEFNTNRDSIIISRKNFNRTILLNFNEHYSDLEIINYTNEYFFLKGERALLGFDKNLNLVYNFSDFLIKSMGDNYLYKLKITNERIFIIDLKNKNSKFEMKFSDGVII